MGLRELAADQRPRLAPSGDVPALECRGVTVALGERVLLDALDLVVEAGESVAVMGPSGSGKTTLLHCVAGIRPIDAGAISIGGEPLAGRSDAARARVRLERVGMVFQFGELLPELDVAENVGLPERLRGRDPGPAVARTLEELGLGDRGTTDVGRLSGGEVQRVAIARAVVGAPDLLLADEPTGALDLELSESVCDLLLDQARRRGAGLVVATHDPLVASAMDRTLRLAGGRLVAVQ